MILNADARHVHCTALTKLCYVKREKVKVGEKRMEIQQNFLQNNMMLHQLLLDKAARHNGFVSVCTLQTGVKLALALVVVVMVHHSKRL